MKKLWLVLLVLAIAIPASAVCPETDFDVYRILKEKWEHVSCYAGMHIAKNPKIGELPDYVVLLHHQSGGLMAYLYLYSEEIVMFVYDGKCYRNGFLEPDKAEAFKKLLLKMRNGVEI